MPRPTLLLTRPIESAERFERGLSPDALAKVDVVFAPLLRIEPTGATVNLDGIKGVIFTSGYGVRLAPNGQNRPAFCVGASTAELARARGWDVQHVSQTALLLIEELQHRQPPAPLCHLSGKHQRGDIAQTLTLRNMLTHQVVLYDQVTCSLTSAARAALQFPTIAPLFSPRTASQFVKEVPNATQIHVVALSDAVAAECAGLGFAKITVISIPSGDEMAKRVEEICLGTTSA